SEVIGHRRPDDAGGIAWIGIWRFPDAAIDATHDHVSGIVRIHRNALHSTGGGRRVFRNRSPPLFPPRRNTRSKRLVGGNGEGKGRGRTGGGVTVSGRDIANGPVRVADVVLIDNARRAGVLNRRWRRERPAHRHGADSETERPERFDFL